MKPLLQAFVCLSFLLGMVAMAQPGHALEVQACLAVSDALQITDDPALCPTADRLDAISAKVSLQVQGEIPIPGPLVLSKRVDQASPMLFLGAATSRHFPNVLVVFFEGNNGGATRGRRLFSILLTDSMILSLEDFAQDEKQAIPLEMVQFNYIRLQMLDDTTGATSCFDFSQNRRC